MPTEFCRIFGIDQPVIAAPMSGITTPELAAAVSNGGGLGLLPVWSMDPPAIRKAIARTRARTDKPFGVNLNMDFPNPEQLDICLDAGIDIISLFWGDSAQFAARARDAGARVIITASSAERARMAADQGADAICAQGWEAGGHVEGTIGTLALVPRVVDAAPGIPVIAAGGIADGRGLAAALALGASAAWIGTGFLAATEAATHPHYRARLLAAAETDTERSADLYDIGWPDAPHRALKNTTLALWKDAGKPPLGQRPGEGDVIAHRPDKGPVLRYQSASASAAMEGDIEATSMWAGQGVGLVTETRPAARIIAEITGDARAILPF